MWKWELIYNSAIKLFWDLWPKNVSIDMIVDIAWVGKWTFYNYYKNKDELYEKIVLDIFDKWHLYVEYLSKNVSDIKERFLMQMIWSIHFFEKNKIIKNLIAWDKWYFYWNINHEKLYNDFVYMTKQLLWNEKINDEDFFNILVNVKSYYLKVLTEKKNFKTKQEYEEFALKLASILVNWLFSDYNSLIRWKTLKDFIKKTK